MRLPQVGLFCDGVAVKQVGEETFRLCRELVDEVMLVDTDAICAAIKDVFEDTRSILEPAGALASPAPSSTWRASGIRDRTLVAIACGANMNFDRLRFVAERAELGEQREAILAVTIPERPGSFKTFCGLLGPRSITEFNYRYADAQAAHVSSSGVQVHDRKETAQLVRMLEQHGFKAVDMSDNEMAKLHVRHLVGGHAPQAKNEIVYRFEFPERPGALHEIPRSDEHGLEHQPVPLPQPRRRLWAGAGGHAGAARGQARVPRLPRRGRLSLLGRDRQPGVSSLPGLRTGRMARALRPATGRLDAPGVRIGA